MKDQIRIQVFGLGWGGFHHPWSTAGHEFRGEQLTKHIKMLIKRGKKIKIYDNSTVDIPTRNIFAVLGTISPDIIISGAKKSAKEGKLIETVEVLKNING